MNFHYSLLLVLLLVIQFQYAESARILAVLPAPGFSHQIVYRSILKGLHAQGHDLTVLTPSPLRDKAPKQNYKEIDLSILYSHSHVKDFTTCNKYFRALIMYYLLYALEKLAEKVYTVPEFQELIRNDHFDLVLVEISFHASFFALGEHFNCPTIGIRSLGLRIEAHDLISNPVTPSYLSVAFMENDHGFFGRVVNTLMVFYIRFLYKYHFLPRAEVITKLNYPKHNIYIGDLEKKLSLIFIGTHPIISGPRPLMPRAIEIGGIHLQDLDTDIPEDIKMFLDKSTNGTILFSLGTLVSFAHLPKENFDTVLSALEELPYDVLFKTDLNITNFRSKNVKLLTWIPQYAILGHPKIKLFVTQGGINSVTEAIANKVPMIVIPFHTDQYHNGRRMEILGVGSRFDFTNLTKDNLVNCITKVITNSSYQQNVENVASQIQDQPMSPLNRAIFWIEYVLRHKGAPNLKTEADDKSWIEYYLIDVFVFLIIVFIISLYTIYCFIKWLHRIIFCCIIRKLKSKNE